jgi:hypothetical protein
VSLQGGSVVRPGIVWGSTVGVGETVALLRQDNTWLCLGSILTASEPRSVIGANTLIGFGGVNSGGAEVAIASASYTTEPTMDFSPQRIFRCHLAGMLNNLSAGNDSGDLIRIRKGTATTVGTLLYAWRQGVNSVAGIGDFCSVEFIGYWKNSSDNVISTKLTISHQRTSGAAVTNLSNLNGIGSGGLWVEDYCSITERPDIAGTCVSIHT